MNNIEMLKIVEQFSRETEGVKGPMKVMRVPDSKTMYVETIGEIGRSILFTEYKVDGKAIWAGYSLRSNTVFVSLAG